MCAAEASTVTVSEARPSASFTWTEVVDDAFTSTSASSVLLKFGEETVMWYEPRINDSTRNSPFFPLIVLRLVQPYLFSTSTVAPTTTAALGSVTVPTIVPSVACEKVTTEPAKTANKQTIRFLKLCH